MMLRREVLAARSPDMPRLRDAVWQFGLGALALTVVFYGVVLLCAASCDVEQETKDIGADFAEVTYCPLFDCGQVFQCTLPTPYGRDGGTLTPELCWENGDAGPLATEIAQQYGYPVLCVPTPRGGEFGWPCIYQCPSAKGCDAYQGCFCGGD